ncbi:calcium-activated potassium channel subunit beta-3 [Myotis lucifugus]|uniref:calcium-activated potassium channel subunit beta-3 n=1 Tax=Myotis lucifugus TaxID=59463 RepID=UPI000CCC8B08|nr:calcium-activated potassium channel subunit beta-3 [Myotis lucifugus]
MLKHRPLAPSEAMTQVKGAHAAQPCGLMQPFSIPVQITLQGGRRRQGRTAISTSGRKRNTDHNGGDPPDEHKKLPSSAGEDRAMLLGFTMMGFSVLMFFLFGITILKPFMLSTQREEANCTVIHTRITDDGMDCAFACGEDCQGQGKYPCLQVLVNLTHSGQKALLHYNEEAVQINSKCDVTDYEVKEKQTLTVSDEHKHKCSHRPSFLLGTARLGRGLKFSDTIILYSQYNNTCTLLCQILFGPSLKEHLKTFFS